MNQQPTELRSLLNELESETFEVHDVFDGSDILLSVSSSQLPNFCSSSCSTFTSTSSCA